MEEERETERSTIATEASPVESPDPIAAEAKAPQVEVYLFRRGLGPAAVFRSRLGGRGQDRLEVQDILHSHGLKSLFAFNPASGRGVTIRFSPRDGRSFIPYSDGAVILLDGEPQESSVKPISKILFGVAVIALLMALLVMETPRFFKASRSTSSGGAFSAWILACVVVVFTRVRKRGKDFMKRQGWLS